MTGGVASSGAVKVINNIYNKEEWLDGLVEQMMEGAVKSMLGLFLISPLKIMLGCE